MQNSKPFASHFFSKINFSNQKQSRRDLAEWITSLHVMTNDLF
ncbi:hypothetical protein GAGA_0051 [Paraglaciecola agarilytica NO2]|uniref:PH domain-containing protein n=1 Tax=Paraglaciecola agarilytica NO2 TaxID=1125747 RepID=A0ABQ0I0S5_9ALTE|nr:hypothetical protein GAGA_0051 [Paraglaciecola agarilytica NO2]